MADGDFNLATLWVPVVPETSQVGQKIEDAGDEAKRRWTDKVKDFGKTISKTFSPRPVLMAAKIYRIICPRPVQTLRADWQAISVPPKVR